MSAHDGADPATGLAGGDQARRRRLAALLDGHGGTARGAGGVGGRLRRVTAVAPAVLGVDGAGVTVMTSTEGGRDGVRDQLAATGPLTPRLEELQLTTGQGPCLDAFASGEPVLVHDLAAERGRWLGFDGEALANGVVAVFSFPLQVGAVRLGTLDLYRTTVGALSADRFADALALAGLATEAVLEFVEQGGTGGPADHPADGVPDADPHRWDRAGWLPHVHSDVHVASGMVSVRAGISTGAALLRIRAHAYAHGEPIGEVARRIIARELELPDEPSVPHTAPEETEDT